MIKSITLELRPRLQICNTFICLQNEINLMKIRIKLLEESIEITIDDNIIKLLTKCLKLIPHSLSALNITNNWICFRTQIKSDSAFGCFQTEMVTNLTPNITVLRDSIENIKVLKNHNCNILCACCKNILSRRIFIKRVLPIPDMNYDLNDWFCCKHNYISVSQNLIPLESDIFYGSLFIIVCKSLFNNLKIEENTVFCNRCLQYIGKIYTNSTFKLWSCSVDYNFVAHSKIERPLTTDPFIDFLIAIKITMTGVFGEEITLQSFVGKKIHSLILKPMDWHLNLITESKTISNNHVVSLQNISVVKVLYKYDISKSAIDFVNKTYCEVGYLVIKSGLEHLLTSTNRFPQPHRTVSDYYIGHICLDNHK
ncbi:uncharacterized protein LOC143265531 [Megachile rotundata]|uniref:uncharacterized protein LOC143265531 n=1 Tax=Megachile rotundata TaxID=143995 RepID=UPI003FD1674A